MINQNPKKKGKPTKSSDEKERGKPQGGRGTRGAIRETKRMEKK